MPKVNVTYLTAEEEKLEEIQEFYEKIPEWDAIDRDSGTADDLEPLDNINYYPADKAHERKSVTQQVSEIIS